MKNPSFLVLIQILTFTIALTSLLTVEVNEMGSGDFWVNQIIPLPYWIGLIVLVSLGVLMIPHLEEKRFRYALVSTAILVIITVRMAFPIIFTSIPSYEPDTSSYMNAVSTWINSGLNLGVSGLYQHDFPLSFLIAYFFIKLGVSIDTFWRAAPFAVYIFDLLLIYLIIKELAPDRPKLAPISVFLFSFSSLGAWVSVHYCPDLVGSLFFLLCLYLTIKFNTARKWTFNNLSILIVCTVLLVLAHHLSTLYFIASVIGLAVASQFFKTKPLGEPIGLFLIGIFTYTFWFVYGNLMYNAFFNISNYFTNYGGYTSQIAQGTPLMIIGEYLTYPVFIIILTLFGFLELLKITNVRQIAKHIRDFKQPFEKLRSLKLKITDKILIYNAGMILNFLVFILGFAVSVVFNDRIMEILFVGFYPLASLTVLKFSGVQLSKKRLALLIILFTLIALIDTTRYYSSMQRRILFG